MGLPWRHAYRLERRDGTVASRSVVTKQTAGPAGDLGAGLARRARGRCVLVWHEWMWPGSESARTVRGAGHAASAWARRRVLRLDAKDQSRDAAFQPFGKQRGRRRHGQIPPPCGLLPLACDLPSTKTPDGHDLPWQAHRSPLRGPRVRTHRATGVLPAGAPDA